MSSATFRKLAYLVWRPEGMDRVRLRQVLVGECAPKLAAAGAVQLAIDVADDAARLSAPGFSLVRDPPIAALVSLWVEDPAARDPIEACLRAPGFRVAGYRVDETLYTDYGENRHAAPRHWPDGERSPGLTMVALLERPRGLDREEWLRRWHGRISPVSEALQPRTRYVRNVVLEALTPEAPAIDGIVEEVWASRRHVKNPFLYFGARHPFALLWNLFRILRAVTSCLRIWRIRSVMTSEYLLRTDPRIPRVRRGPYDAPAEAPAAR